ncbi:Uncharacterised protein [Vibrio cholerae]|nr:Uncharacterised protein [Vibrio cholerae]
MVEAITVVRVFSDARTDRSNQVIAFFEFDFRLERGILQRRKRARRNFCCVG